MSEIILATLNARYNHASLGLRYLQANMGDLSTKTELIEFVINNRVIDIAETLLRGNPKIIGLSVYIWNVEQTTKLVSLLKNICPKLIIIIGGPEVSFEHEHQKIASLADYIITGPADLAFAELCEKVLTQTPVKENVIKAQPAPLPYLNLPYDLYNSEDIKNRVIYVEASRGCPFKCEFCLSSLDKTAWPFDLDLFLAEMDKLYQRGARDFKFIDRTFNLKINSSIKILTFFLAKNDKDLYLHFELIPDHLPEKLKAVLQKFPEGSLQFEIGIQTFNPEVQSLISRKQNNEKSQENIKWLRENTHAHLHTDIIMGLPGETVDSIASSFNQLIALNPHEIQMGILKRLRGTPLIRHTEKYEMCYNFDAPYNLLCNKQIDFLTMQRLTRFARFWDIIANSGRFSHTLPVILDDNPFYRFLSLSDSLFALSQQTFKIALPRLFELLFNVMKNSLEMNVETIERVLWLDYQISGLKGYPKFISQQIIKQGKISIAKPVGKMPRRQSRHAKILNR